MFTLSIVAASDKISVIDTCNNELCLQGIDYLKYDNCNTDGSKPTVR